MIIKTFCWGLLLTIICLICALFLTPSYTTVCSNMLVSCLQSHVHHTGIEKLSEGLGCIFQNIACVLTNWW